MSITQDKFNDKIQLQEKKIDEEFIKLMFEIEKQYSILNKHDRIRTEQWTKKLCQVTTNFQWKKNRNLYARQLLNCVYQQKFTKTFKSIPPEGPLQQFSQQENNILCYDINSLLNNSQIVNLNQQYPSNYLSIDSINNTQNNNQNKDQQIYFHEKSFKALQNELETSRLNEMNLIKEIHQKDEELAKKQQEIDYLNVQNQELAQSNGVALHYLNQSFKYLKEKQLNPNQIRKKDLFKEEIENFLFDVENYLQKQFDIQVRNTYDNQFYQNNENEQIQNFDKNQQYQNYENEELKQQKNLGYNIQQDHDYQKVQLQNNAVNNQQFSERNNYEDTSQFLEYLENFQRKTKKLKEETDNFLKQQQEYRNTQQ